MMVWTAGALVLFISQIQDPPKAIYFYAAEGTREAELVEAARVLQKRYEEFGYKGITAKAAPAEKVSRVELYCETGFTREMRWKIEKLATIQARKVELRFTRNLEGKERDQFIEGKTAPPDAEWMKSVDYRNDEEWLLVRKEPKLDVSTSLQWHKEGTVRVEKDTTTELAYWFEFKGDSVRVLRSLKPEVYRGMTLLIDGMFEGQLLEGHDLGGGLLRGVGAESKEHKTVLWQRDSSVFAEIIGTCINFPVQTPLKSR